MLLIVMNTHGPFPHKPCLECCLITAALRRVEKAIHSHKFDLAGLSLKENLSKCALSVTTTGFLISLIIPSLYSVLVQLGLTYFVPSLQGFACVIIR